MKKPTLTSRFVSFAILTSFVMSLGVPLRAEAQFGGVLTGAATSLVGGAIESFFTGGSISADIVGRGGVPVSDTATRALLAADNLKESTLDSIAWVAANALLEEITSSIVNWINTGFEGEPAFVSNPEGLLLDIADQATGAYIKELGIGDQICGPFQLQIRLSLLRNYQRQQQRERYSCTLGRVVQNIEGFLNDFEQGGWPAWLSIIQEENNPYYRLFDEQSRLQNLAATGVANKERELNWGKGFLSMKNAKGEIVTPGAILSDQLNEALGSGTRRLEAADEFDEIISALLNQLIKQVITGPNGLLGSSRPDPTNNNQIFLDSYTGLDAPRDEFLQASQNLIDAIDTNIDTETGFRDALEDSKFLLQDTALLYRDLMECSADTIREIDRIQSGGETFFGDQGTPATRQARKQELLLDIANASSTIATEVDAYIPRINDTIRSTDVKLQQLRQLRQDTGFARSVSQVKAVSSAYLEISQTTHSLDQLAQAQAAYQSLQNQINTATQPVRAKLNTCGRI